MVPSPFNNPPAPPAPPPPPPLFLPVVSCAPALPWPAVPDPGLPFQKDAPPPEPPDFPCGL